jgi:hypothetical protein
MSAVFLSGSKRVSRVFGGKLIQIGFSTMLFFCGSKVNFDGPVIFLTFIRINCKNESVPESPIYTMKRYVSLEIPLDSLKTHELTQSPCRVP